LSAEIVEQELEVYHLKLDDTVKERVEGLSRVNEQLEAEILEHNRVMELLFLIWIIRPN